VVDEVVEDTEIVEGVDNTTIDEVVEEVMEKTQRLKALSRAHQ